MTSRSDSWWTPPGQPSAAVPAPLRDAVGRLARVFPPSSLEVVRPDGTSARFSRPGRCPECLSPMSVQTRVRASPFSSCRTERYFGKHESTRLAFRDCKPRLRHGMCAGQRIFAVDCLLIFLARLTKTSYWPCYRTVEVG